MEYEYKPINNVKALENKLLFVGFVTGSSITLDMSEYLKTIRYRCLQDEETWKEVATDGYLIYWKGVDLSYEEVLLMATEKY
ncbi:MAG TPA: DUF2442 domain-containing protein [Candidatus Dorea intestinavium]|nr:DUF2442 domain-containing protein [Candidatus Dorea intestinavium]